MFSLFRNGIKDTKSPTLIDFRSLVTMIQDSPNKAKIRKIRELRAANDQAYKTLKLELPNITPNCYVSERSIGEKETFESNFKGMSKYIYFDFDDVEDINSYKNHLINQYGAYCSLISTSSSGKGVSMIIRVNSGLNEFNYTHVWNYIRKEILGAEDVDMKSRNLGRAWFVPYDSDVFCNYESDIVIPDEVLKQHSLPYEVPKVKDVIVEGVRSEVFQNMLNRLFDNLDKEIEVADEIIINGEKHVNISDLVWTTPVEVNEPILEFKPVIVDHLYFPILVKDGKKRSTFCKLVRKILKLNPYKTEAFIYAALYKVNQKHTDVPMLDSKLRELVHTIFNKVQKEGHQDNEGKLKYIHFNKDCTLDKKSKLKIANSLIGISKRNKSIDKIKETISLLESKNIKVTKAAISKYSGLNPSTIRRNISQSKIDVQDIVKGINSSAVATVSLY